MLTYIRVHISRDYYELRSLRHHIDLDDHIAESSVAPGGSQKPLAIVLIASGLFEFPLVLFEGYLIRNPYIDSYSISEKTIFKHDFCFV